MQQKNYVHCIRENQHIKLEMGEIIYITPSCYLFPELDKLDKINNFSISLLFEHLNNQIKKK